MATEAMAIGRRSRVWAVLIALALTLAVVVVVAQATSIWSTKTVPQVRPAPVQYSLSPKELKALSLGPNLPKGCRIKYGCADGATLGQP